MTKKSKSSEMESKSSSKSKKHKKNEYPVNPDPFICQICESNKCKHSKEKKC